MMFQGIMFPAGRNLCHDISRRKSRRKKVKQNKINALGAYKLNIALCLWILKHDSRKKKH